MRFVEFKNRTTGTQMWVAEDRVEEYKAAGHVLAAEVSQEPVKETKPAVTAKAPVKRATRKK